MTYPTHTIYVIYYYVKKTLKPLNPKTQELYDNTCMTWKKKLVTLLDLCVSSLRRGHANLLCIVPILTDGNLRRGSTI